MRGEPTTFWGKLERADTGEVLRWHPLIDHCADVAAVTESLLRLPLWHRRLSRLAGCPIPDVTVARLCVLAALHDIGKLNVGFQARGRPGLGPIAGHVGEAVTALRQPVFAGLSALSAWGDCAPELLIAALCHHGKPHNYRDTTKWQRSHWQSRAGLDPSAALDSLLDACQRWFPDAFEGPATPLPDSRAFAHGFAGLVMLADWIGSDTHLFPFTDELDDVRMPFSRERAQRAVEAMWIDVPLGHRADPHGRDAFARIRPGNYAPRPAQAVVATLPRDADGSITVLESETGSGKTEAALARFVTLFEAGLVDGLYFALPTRTAATQIHRRVHEALRRAFAVPPPVVLAVPGYLRVDDTDGRRLAPFQVLWTDHEDERSRYRKWAAENTKRYLAGAVVVGTIDQVLLSSLMVGHAHLRATSLLRHLLVVDEVHASDAYMGRILEDVLMRHRAAGGHALLLSATLGGEARSRLLLPGPRRPSPTLAEAESAPYPLVSHSGTAPLTISVDHETGERVITMVAWPRLAMAAAVALEALMSARRGAKVLVIRNTVADCVATQIALEAEAQRHDDRMLLFGPSGGVAPHHARYARQDREILDNALEARFGRARAEGGCVVIATQTVQQSLDLDADLLISDLCPADVLLQRIGRLHRHVRARPTGFEYPKAIVLIPEQRDLGVLIGETGHVRGPHGLGTVYPDLRVLEATWRLLEAHAEWRIPAMNRHLVEHSVHSCVLDAIVEQGGARWQEHAQQMLGTARGHARQAELNLVDWQKPYCETSFPSGVEQRIPTRLGESDRRIRFSSPVSGPFGATVSELTLPSMWSRGLVADDEFATHLESTCGVVTFTFGGKAFVYDRLGLRPAVAIEEEAQDDGP